MGRFADVGISRSGQAIPGYMSWFNAESADMNNQLTPYNTDVPGEDEWPYNDHGTALLSVVAGKTVGLLRKARPILVKHTTDTGIESGLRAIASHILSSGTQETPVSYLIACCPAIRAFDIRRLTGMQIVVLAVAFDFYEYPDNIADERGDEYLVWLYDRESHER
jgi:hypothetical protein